MNAGSGDKWLTGVEPNDPISRAAQFAIENRLKFFWSCLKQAGKKTNPSTEEVHQARVSARRAMAAVETFESLLPKGRSTWIRKQIKRVRRIAGDARDDDVMLMRLQQSNVQPSEANTEAEIPLWRAQLEAERALHQVPIGKIFLKLKKKHFRQRAKKLVDKIKWRKEEPEPTYHDAALDTVRALLSELEATLLGGLPPEEELHPLRITVKRLRYVLELFKSAFTTPLMQDEIYPQVETMQNLLGAVNDHVSAIERVETWLETSNDECTVSDLQKLLHEESDMLEQSQTAFEQWWQSGEARILCDRLRQLAIDSA